MADKPHITKDGYVAHLVRVGVWATPQNPIQYAFLEQKPAYLPNEQGWTPFSAAQRTAVQHAFAMIAEVVNLTFVQVADNQQIPGPTNPRINFYANSVNLNFSGSMDPYYAGGSDAIHGADIRLNNARIAQRQTNEGFQDFTSFVALHEVLHAMGLSHPGDYNGQGFNYQDHAEFVEDTIQYSVMSYWAAANAGADHVEGNVQYHARTPLLYDILALQSLYAPNMTTRAGDTVYGFNSNTGANSPFNFAAAAGPVVAIWDAGGIDTIDLSGYSSASLIDLNEGEFSDAGGLTKNIAIAFGVTIENAVGGAGNDKLTGNAAANRLEGGGGDDLLDGRGGADLLVGGAGNDLYLVDHAGDAAVEAAGGGTDEVRTALSAFALGANVEVLKGMSASGQVLTGNDEANVIEGGAGDDFIDGRGGADEMRGGQGFDIYIVDDPGDRVTEVSDYGLDEVRTNLASYALPADVEKLTGTSAGGQTLTGNGGANLITGAAGNDVIEGGAGPDELRGGAGNDLLTDAAGSTAAHGEGGNDRISIVQAAAGVLGDTYTLTGGDGDDEIRISVRGHVGVSIDAGSGDDRVVIASLDPEAQTRVTLGAGRDILTVKSEGANGLPYVDVADFAAGEAGDRIDLDALMAARLTNWNPGDNPFATGHLALVQAGADAVIQIDLDGGGDQLRELVRLENVHESTLVEANLGFAVPRTQGTSGNDRLSGTAAGEVFRLEQGGVDSASGRGGDDVFYFGGAFTTLDRVDGGDGTDEVVLQGDYFPPRHATMVLANVERLTLLSGGDDRFGGASAAAAGYTLDLPDTFLFSGGTLIVDASGLTASESLNFSGGVTSGGAFVLRGGAGGDTLIGGAGSDFIEAGGGDDHLNGMGGADLMRGGAGSDDYYLDHAGDVVEEADVAGVDTVHVALAAYALGPNVERLYGFATNGGQALTGNALANVILGTSGNDVLDGGAGADEMSGGDGNDVFIVDDHGDRAGDQQGVDEIHTHLAAYGLGDAWGIENLTGTSGSGQALTGNKFANRIAGGSGNDVIDGRAGADAMHGGAGDDLYFADDGGDVVVELPGGGNDEVRVSAASYALGENVETLVGTSNAGQVLSGNFQANIIRAGAGDDTIYAGGGNDALHGGAGRDGIYAGAGDDVIDGGAGPDYMVGQAGDDLYLVDDAGDEALEAANEGLDEVRTAISFALGAHVENLTGTGSSGQILTGNGGDNRIVGGTGDDVLTGGDGNDFLFGHIGADIVKGGLGDDIYLIDAADTIVEHFGEGTDEVRTVGTLFVLGAGLDNLRGLNDGGHDFRGNAGPNALIGAAGNDILRMQDGGDDLAFGKGGVDSFYFGAAFDQYDLADGGDNRDSLILQGNYDLTLMFAPTGGSSIVGIESISLVSGMSAAYGDTSARLYSYDLTLIDDNVAAGALMKVNGFHLLAGENLAFDASAELDAPLQIFAGLGRDTLIGGAQGDSFVFGQDGRFSAGDTVVGGGGYDILYLRGDYAIDFNAAGFAGALSGVESIALLTSANTEFVGGGDGDFDYSIVWNDAMLAAGGTMTVNGGRLQGHETFAFDAASESDAHLRVFGGAGADTLATGAGNDQLYGGGGGDTLTGGAGADLYRILAASDSRAGAFDTINGFAPGQDRIDLQRIDAKAATPDENDAFAYIGNAAFTAAGQLRAVHVSGNLWQVEGDVDGDGIADLVLQVHVDGGQMPSQSDFLL